MAGEVLNMSNLTINKHRCKLKDLCFKNRHKTIYPPLCVIASQKGEIMKVISRVLFLMLLSYNIHAENETFSISGKVFFSYQKPIYIFLVDEETSKKPFVGIDTLIIIPNSKDITNGYITFKFTNIKKGEYGIRCFQDINGNKKLDRGLFGPKEPWGLSWNKYKTFWWPSFKDFCFILTSDKKYINIKLKD